MRRAGRRRYATAVVLGQRGWTPAEVTLTQSAALLPPVVAAIMAGGTAMLGVLATALAVTLLWELAFAQIRKRDLTWHGLTTALIVTAMLPADTVLWQLGVALTLGVVLGELVFGGRGFGFLSAAAASLAFLSFSFPGATLADPGGWIAAAALPGAVLLLLTGLISWRVLLAAGLAFALAGALAGLALSPVEVVPALLFGLVFLTCDPVAAASTNAGRWLYGAVAGGLIVVFGGTGATPDPAALVFATLLGSIFAPLLDHLVVLEHARRRGRVRNA